MLHNAIVKLLAPKPPNLVFPLRMHRLAFLCAFKATLNAYHLFKIDNKIKKNLDKTLFQVLLFNDSCLM
jgi:hypothetical protein